MEYGGMFNMLGHIEVEEHVYRPRRARNPPVINRRMNPTEALGDVEFKSHFRYV
jgi:hypothetical protein